MKEKKKIPRKKSDGILSAGKKTGRGSVPKKIYQSGAAPYLKTEDGELRVMLVTPGQGGNWILPKGHIARGMGTPESAAKEAFEEAGVRGKCGKKILGISSFQRPGGETVVINLYPLKIEKILSDWEESGIRKRRLFRIEHAIELMRTEEARDALRTLRELIVSGKS